MLFAKEKSFKIWADDHKDYLNSSKYNYSNTKLPIDQCTDKTVEGMC